MGIEERSVGHGVGSASPVFTMSTSVDYEGSYSGQSFSVSQLLYAAKRKLQGATFGGRCVWAVFTGHENIQTRILQDRDDPELHRGEGRRETVSNARTCFTLVFVLGRCPRASHFGGS